MFRRTPLATSLSVAFGGVALMAATAASAQTAPAPAPQRIEITGTNIKRVDAETVAPVTVITREEIERSGQPTVAEVIRNVSSNAGSFGESFSNSFAPGASGISLRGLGQKTTLVLINGRRVAGYGFAQNLQDTFVDLNSIPSSAVERIDILRDGASAIYGSDAIAGVVNIILRKDFRGVEMAMSGGTFHSKKDYGVSLTGGTGDLASQKYNIFGMLDFYHRDELLASDTEFLATRDMRRFEGGRNFVGLTTGGTWRQLTATNGLTNNYRAITDCPGTRMTGTEAAAAGLINVGVNAAGQPIGSAANLATAAATNTFCTADINNALSALPGTDRVGGLVRGTFELSPTATLFGEVGLSHNETKQTFTPPFFSGSTGLSSVNGVLVPFPYNINFAPGSAGNPFTSNARFLGSHFELGTRNSEITSDTWRALVGGNFTVGKWDLDSAVGMSRTRVDSVGTNRLSLAGASAALGVTSASQPPTPVSTAALYNLDRPTTNSAALRDQMTLDVPRSATSTLKFIDTRANTTVGKMSGGDVGLAVGFEYRVESLQDKPGADAVAGNILGQGITATDGYRNNGSVFTELSLPFTKSLEAQAAFRHDRYSDYGSSTTPKIGLKWRATDQLLVRGNWGKGFRAPTLPEISPSVATFFVGVIDPEDGNARNISGVFAGNPNLRPETSVSRVFGAVFEPSKNMSFGLDYYAITWRDVVASPSFQTIVDDSCPNGPPCPSTANVFRDPLTNFVTQISSNYENLNVRKVSGVDFDWKLAMPTNHGKYTFRGDVNYVRSFEEDGTEVAGTNNGSNTIPRIRGSMGLDFDAGAWSMTGTARYTHSYYNCCVAAFGNPATVATTFQNGVYPRRTKSHTLYDLTGRYKLNKNLQVSLSIINLFDKAPPYDPGFSTTYFYDFSLHDIRGRQIRAGLKYSM